MSIKNIVKKFVKNIKILEKIYLKISKKTKNFNRDDLFKFSNSQNEIKINDLNFFIKLNNHNNEIENVKVDKSINSVLGWVPFSKNKSSIIIYNFFSQNYSLRGNFLLRASIILDGKIIKQKLFWIKPNTILNFFSKNFDIENSCDSIIVELFNPKLKKNHGHHDGHLRFWGQYFDEKKNIISTTHSMPLSYENNYLSKQNLSRSYFKLNKNYNFKNYFLNSKLNSQKERLNFYGYAVIENKINNFVSTWHLAPINDKKKKKTEISQLAWCPQGKNLDPYILIDNLETGIENQRIILAIIINNEIVYKKEFDHSGIYFEKISDIFPKIENNYLIYIKYISYGHSYFNIAYNNSLSFGDQVHSHETKWEIKGSKFVSNETNPTGNTRKFFYLNKYKEDCFHYLSLNIDKIKNKDFLRLNIRLLTDSGIEKLIQKKIHFNKPHLFIKIEEEFIDLKNLDYKNAIIQIESFDNNINGSFLYQNNNGTIAVDHLTGG
jgi:hypothetical protein